MTWCSRGHVWDPESTYCVLFKQTSVFCPLGCGFPKTSPEQVWLCSLIKKNRSTGKKQGQRKNQRPLLSMYWRRYNHVAAETQPGERKRLGRDSTPSCHLPCICCREEQPRTADWAGPKWPNWARLTEAGSPHHHHTHSTDIDHIFPLSVSSTSDPCPQFLSPHVFVLLMRSNCLQKIQRLKKYFFG